MLKPKLQCFSHLMLKSDSFERTLMLGKVEGKSLGASSDEQAMTELRTVRQQSGFTHSGSLLLQGL